jgi:hypothetical protein
VCRISGHFPYYSFLFVREKRKPDVDQRIDRTTPPSAREAAPFVADESRLATNATSAATSSGVAKRFRSEVGRAVVKNSLSTVAGVECLVSAKSSMNFSPPS